MGSYNLVFKASVAKDLRGIPNQDVSRILTRIEGLVEDPRPPVSEKLSGQARYRARQGVDRIIYELKNHRLRPVGLRHGLKVRIRVD